MVWKIAVRSSFSEFHAPFWDLSSRMNDLTHYWGHLSDSKETLIKKGKEFQRRSYHNSNLLGNINNLSTEEERLIRLKNSIQSLEEEVGLSSRISYKPLVTRVSRRTLPSWWQSFTLRKGRTYGLQKGMGVVFHNGVVGRISSVGSIMSDVELSTNTNFRIVAHFEGDERPVTFQGNGILPGGFPSGLVLDVPQDFDASQEKPLRLITSSLGEMFPRGIELGKVYELEGGEDGLFQTGLVKMSKDLCSVQEVTVLFPNKLE